MDYEADIVVQGESSSSPLLLVEVKIGARLREAEQQLRRYMRLTGVSLGLLVTPEHLLLLHDTYHPNLVESIETIGPFPTQAIEALRVDQEGAGRAYEFESRVRGWLESLRSEVVVAQTPEALRSLVVEWLAPVVAAGEVGAAGPRAA